MIDVLPQQMPMPCAKCGGEVLVAHAIPRLANTPEVSVMVIAHEAVVECPHCRTKLGVILGAVEKLMFRTAELQTKEQPRVLLPPNGNFKF